MDQDRADLELLQFTDVALEGDHRLCLQLFLWLALAIIYVFIWLVLCSAGDGWKSLVPPRQVSARLHLSSL